MTSRPDSVVSCIKCGQAQPQAGRFCSACGWDQQKALLRSRLTPANFALFVVAAGAIWGSVKALELTHPLGKQPTQVYVDPAANTDDPAVVDKTVEDLRAQTRAKPNDKETWKALAGALIQRVQLSDKPSNQMLFDLVDALREVLRLDPMDTDALRAMADASLNNNILDKAIDYYVRYLALIPQDVVARGRYGSALAMASRYQEAQAELQKVLAEDPKNFSASAYLALSYAGLEDKAKALEVGRQALALAGDDEARSELEKFLASLEKGEVSLPKAKQGSGGASLPAAAEPKKPENAQVNSANSSDAMIAALSAIVSGNPVAGPKFDRVEREGASFKIYMLDFPMAAMPPFVKQKFISGVSAKAIDAGIVAGTQIDFVDSSSKQILESLTLK
jgi:tetratricopeptide (TPR) repeat protein